MITIDERSPQPVFAQIQNQIGGLIRTGTLPAGQKLPSVRQLAKDLQVATGTVMRAYTELEADGLIETHAGSAARVRAGHQLPEAVRNPAVALIATAHQQGMSMSDTVQAIQALWAVDGGNPFPPTDVIDQQAITADASRLVSYRQPGQFEET